MQCLHLAGPHGATIVCGPFLKRRPCVSCGGESARLCDWKIGDGRTCDAAVCDEHTYSPEPDKDLCPGHHGIWLQHKFNQRKTGERYAAQSEV